MKAQRSQDLNYRIAFRMIRAVHDGWLIHRLVDPVELLRTLGAKHGDRVFEIGCGPGFYTVGASTAVGSEGIVYAFDINPYAIRYLRKKLNKLGITNVIAEIRNANESGLPDASVDFAFLFGVPRVTGGVDQLIQEITRLLKPNGILAVGAERGRASSVVQMLLDKGLKLRETKKRYHLFVNTIPDANVS